METTADSQTSTQKTEFSRGLGLFDSTMLVVGVMIGSGIFIVSAEMSRQIASPGWLFVAWIAAGALTIAGALCYGELAAMMPHAGACTFICVKRMGHFGDSCMVGHYLR